MRLNQFNRVLTHISKEGMNVPKVSNDNIMTKADALAYELEQLAHEQCDAHNLHAVYHLFGKAMSVRALGLNITRRYRLDSEY